MDGLLNKALKRFKFLDFEGEVQKRMDSEEYFTQPFIEQHLDWLVLKIFFYLKYTVSVLALLVMKVSSQMYPYPKILLKSLRSSKLLSSHQSCTNGNL